MRRDAASGAASDPQNRGVRRGWLSGGWRLTKGALRHTEDIEPAHPIDLESAGVEDPVVVLTLEELGLDLVDVPVDVVYVVDVHGPSIGTKRPRLNGFAGVRDED